MNDKLDCLIDKFPFSGVHPSQSSGGSSRNTRIVQQSGEVPLNANEETSGLENLAKIKLGEFPLRQQSLEEQQLQLAMEKFLLMPMAVLSNMLKRQN